MFSQGQIQFGICFFIAFVIVMIFAYRKDLKLHKVFYKGNYKVLLAFLLFIALLFVIKIFLKR
ncbi:hypothetical protein [Flavobacterium sp.]|uniref:hypothetical protein n=1 Tax=Flavobacterium sp. TaxID=239 RepID=UPI0025B8630C|nr:hypothetical protein [Flavobacterium sp.]